MNERRKIVIGLAVAAFALVVIVVGILLLRDQTPVEGPPSIDTVGTVTTQGAPSSEGDLVDEPAPAFALPTLDGDTLSLADLEGDVVVINFWATWCAPCRVEIPDLIEMQDELRDEGVRFVGVSLDHEGVETVKAFAADAKINYPIVIDEGEVADAFGGIYALPTTILIDRDGVVVRKIPGLVTKKMLMPILEELAS